MKKGMVLEGGAMRGMFTAGVLDVFMENGLTADGTVGVSAGAVFGCNYKSGQIGRVIRYNKRFAKDKRYGSMRSLIRTGDYYGADFCYRVVPERLDVFDREAFRESPMEFHVVCTDVKTGQAVYHICKDGGEEDLLWMRASASMPVFAKLVEIDGKRLSDGGIADSIPIRYFQQQGYDRCIVILTQPADYVKKKNRAMPLLNVLYRDDPAMLESMRGRHRIYNETVAYAKECEKRGDVLIIQPPQSLKIGRTEHDPEELERVYQMGRAAGKQNLRRAQAFWSE